MTTRVKEAKAKLTCDTFDVKAYNRNQGVRGPNMPIMHPDKKKTAHSGTKKALETEYRNKTRGKTKAEIAKMEQKAIKEYERKKALVLTDKEKAMDVSDLLATGAFG